MLHSFILFILVFLWCTRYSSVQILDLGVNWMFFFRNGVAPASASIDAYSFFIKKKFSNTIRSYTNLLQFKDHKESEQR
jgi:hypothetical protein